MANAERCVCCGEIIPEGRMVCPNCEVASKGKRLIDANELLKVLKHRVKGNEDSGIVLGTNSTLEIMEEWVRSIPTVDAVPVVHGRWEKHGKHDWRCSVCKVGVPYSFTGHSYCHNCGADMRERKDNV